MDILAKHGFDSSKFILGKLCKKGHDFEGTGQSVRYANSRRQCVFCAKNSQSRIRAEAKTEVVKAYQDTQSDAILAQHGFDSSKFILGRICKKGHEFGSTGKSLRYRYTSGRYTGRPKDCAKCIEIQRNQWKQDNYEQYLEKNRRYYCENRDLLIEKARQYYQSHKKERIVYLAKWKERLRTENLEHFLGIQRKYAKNYRTKHREKVLEKRRARYQEKDRAYYEKRYLENREVLLARSKEWRKNNPEKHVARERRRRARKNNNHVASIDQNDLQCRIDDFFGKCAYCQSAKFRDWDHFIPISKGGPESLGNLLPSCQRCNVRKHARDPKEWYESQSFYSKKQWIKILKVLGKTLKNYNQMPFF